MRHARLFSIFVSLTLLAYGAAGFYFLPMATFQAELTRMALLPESMFGWTKPQPAIDAAWLRQASMQEADVLVIGDSFSEKGIWQTSLTRQGYKVRTESWNSMRGICADFMPWLRAQGFRGHHIVLESVERNLISDIQKSVACEKMQYHPDAETDAPRHPPAVSNDIHYGDYSGRLSTGITTWLTALDYERRSAAPDFAAWQLRNEVTLARIPDGCSLFSHTRCNDALFYSIDRPEDIDPAIMADMQTVESRMPGIKVVWAFVPNKSTAYRYPDKPFWKTVGQHFNAPDLLQVTQHALKDKVVDLYPANNTHFSTSGYLLMGTEILKHLKQ